MTRRRWLTVDGDLELVAGRHRIDPTLASAVILRLRMKRGSCPLLPDLGSRFHTIDKLEKSTGRLAESYAKEALDDLVRRDDIRSLKVSAQVAVGGRLDMTVEFRDRGGERGAVEFTWRVGG